MVLRVRLEVVPFGDEDKAREIGRLDIFNRGEVEAGYHEYGVIQLDPKEHGLHTATILHHRPAGAWELVRRAIEDLRIRGPK